LELGFGGYGPISPKNHAKKLWATAKENYSDKNDEDYILHAEPTGTPWTALEGSAYRLLIITFRRSHHT
jgi:hypothetical protein